MIHEFIDYFFNRPPLCTVFVTIWSSSSKVAEEPCEEPLSYRRQKHQRAEKELHHISEKLSLRLEELDQVTPLILSVCVCAVVF